MAKCPKCGDEIDHLINYCEEAGVYYFSLDDKGEAQYKHTHIFSGAKNEWACPKCDEILSHDEETAIKFLKGGDK